MKVRRKKGARRIGPSGALIDAMEKELTLSRATLAVIQRAEQSGDVETAVEAMRFLRERQDRLAARTQKLEKRGRR